MSELSARYAAVLAASRDAVLLTDEHGRTTEVNAVAERLFGCSREQLLGRTPEQVVALPPGSQAEILALLRAGGRWSGDVEFTRADGSPGICETTVDGIWSGTKFRGTVGTCRDVTEQRRLAAEVRQAEQRWRLTLDHAPTGIALVGLDGRFLKVNAALCRLVGYAEPELIALTFQDITHPEDLDADLVLLAQLTAGEIADYRLDKRYRHASGHEVWVHLSVGLVRDDSGHPLHFVAQVEDITERRRRTARLEHAASRDSLTGLANRSTFLERLDAARSAGAGSSLAVGYVDLDGFKQVNDSAGHAAGDDLLRLVGQRLEAALRPGDLAARHGGDEFALLLTDITRAGLVVVADRLLTALAAPYRLPRQAEPTVLVGASIGFVLTAADAEVPAADTLLARADAAMYAAKASGSNTYRIT